MGRERRGLRNPPVPDRPKPEGPTGGGADAIGAAVHAEEEPVGLRGGDKVAAAAQTEVTVAVMQFYVLADLLETAKDITARTEMEIVGNHSEGETARFWLYNSKFCANIESS